MATSSRPDAGKRKPITQRDIAARCGLHQTAVSLALRRDPSISQATIARVLEVARELGYNPDDHHAARKMVLRRFGKTPINHLIALFVPHYFHQSPFFREAYFGMWDVVTQAGFDLLTANLGSFSDPHTVFHSHSFARGDVDGVIAFAHPAAGRALCTYLRQLHSFGERPITFLIQPIAGASWITVDYAAGSYQAARHLLALGHRHLVQLIARDADEIVAQRLAGICRALVEEGLEPERHLHRVELSAGWIAPAEATADLPPLTCTAGGQTGPVSLPEFLHAHPEVTGLLAWNDACARHAWESLTAAGFRVPADISIIGFDDTDPILEAGSNRLTSVHVPLRQIGETAARSTIARITGPHRDEVQAALPATLIIRSSTAAR
jgi:LacI family transcriptional regulator